MKKKILFINGHLNVGGVERSLVDLLCNLDYNKYEVDLLLLEDKGDYLPQIPKNVNIVFVNLPKICGPFLKILFLNLLTFRWSMIFSRIIIFFANKFGKYYLSKLRRVFALNSFYDVAIAYRPGFCADIAAYIAMAKNRIVWWHHGEINLNPSQIKSYNETWNLFDNIVTVSNVCKEMLLNSFTYPPNKIIVIPNMIDVARIYEKAGDVSPYNITFTKIISVGRLCIEKHFEDVILVVKRLVDDGIKDFHWFIIGDGDIRMQLEEFIKELRVEKYITLLGKKNNPYSWIKYADIYVHSSYVESQGLTILEAMTLNVPCVVCRSAGPSEFIVDGVNAIMTEPNPDSLYNGVIAMMKNKNRSILTREARKIVDERFCSQNIVKLFDTKIASYDLLTEKFN